MAKKLGEITADYRWFAVLYIVLAFFLVPLCVFALSLAGWSVVLRRRTREDLHMATSTCRYVFAGVLGPIVLLVLFVIVINLLQSYAPKGLPGPLRSWSWLPAPLRSLAWYDKHIFSQRCCRCCAKNTVSPVIDHVVHTNESFEPDESTTQTV